MRQLDMPLQPFVHSQDVSVRLRNCIDNASRNGSLPHATLREYLSAGPLAYMHFMKMRNFGKKTGLELDRLIRKVVESGADCNDDENVSSVDVGDVMFDTLLRADNPYVLITDRLWKRWRDVIRAKAAGAQTIQTIATLLKLEWAWNRRDETIEQYLLKELQSLPAIESIGKKKLRVIVLCVAYAASNTSSGLETGPGEESATTEQIVADMLPLLKRKESGVLIERYGLNRSPRRTLVDIAGARSVTRERVRQIEEKALSQLRTFPQFQGLQKSLAQDSTRIWKTVAGAYGTLRQKEVATASSSLSGETLLAIDVCYVAFKKWLPTVAAKTHNGWCAHVIARTVRELDVNRIKEILDGPLPVPLTAVAQKTGIGEDALAAAIALDGRYVLRDGYVARSRGRRVRRGNPSSGKRVPQAQAITDEQAAALFKTILLSQFPTGFAFSTASVALLSSPANRPLTPAIRQILQKQMFQRKDSVWLFPEQVADEHTIGLIRECVDAWERDFGVWQIEALYDRFQRDLRNLPEGVPDFRRFYKTIVQTGAPTQFTRQQEEEASRRLVRHLEDACDCVYEEALLERFPNLTAGIFPDLALLDRNIVRVKDAYGRKGYKHICAFWLPDDFSDTLNASIEEIEAVGDPVTEAILVSWLNEKVVASFCETYAIPDDVTLRDVITACYTGKVSRVWRRHTFVSQQEGAPARHNVLDSFIAKHGEAPFHEEMFFEFAKRTRGLSQKTMLICAFLRTKCIRLDRDYWISAQAFLREASLETTEYSLIREHLCARLGRQPFLSLGTLPLSFFGTLPDFSLHGRHYPWNAYLLTSVCCHAIPALRIVNDEPSPYVVTALLLPEGTALESDVIDYVLDVYATSGVAARAALDIFEYLRQHQVRMTRSETLMNRIRERFGVN